MLSTIKPVNSGITFKCVKKYVSIEKQLEDLAVMPFSI